MRIDSNPKDKIMSNIPLEEILRAEGEKFNHEEFAKSAWLSDEYVFDAYMNYLENKRVVIYYEKPDIKHDGRYYIFEPDSVRVVRASAAEMGNGVLGLAYTGMGLVKILDTLHGADYDEVLKHELNHVKYPNKSEWEIRRMTKQELGGNCKYH